MPAQAMCGQVAQLAEHRTENPGVAGSSPALPTMDGEAKHTMNRRWRTEASVAVTSAQTQAEEVAEAPPSF